MGTFSCWSKSVAIDHISRLHNSLSHFYKLWICWNILKFISVMPLKCKTVFDYFSWASLKLVFAVYEILWSWECIWNDQMIKQSVSFQNAYVLCYVQMIVLILEKVEIKIWRGIKWTAVTIIYINLSQKIDIAPIRHLKCHDDKHEDQSAL